MQLLFSRGGVLLFTLVAFLPSVFVFSGQSVRSPASSLISVSVVKEHFATMTHEQHEGNRIGYRFHEHEPICFGSVPLSNEEANIDSDEVGRLEENYRESEEVVVYKRNIEGSGAWARQDWTYYLKPVSDGVEILMTVKTYGEGLPKYYGIQQCLRMSGSTNQPWRQKIARTPAFSEYDLWQSQADNAAKKSLTCVFRDNAWQQIPATTEPLGARTPLGKAVDYVRTGGDPGSETGPYDAALLQPIEHGLIARTDRSESWICGIFWQRTSHVTNHHPADCLHPIVNIGNIPPYSKRALRGKIYWFKGNKEDLTNRYANDFGRKAQRNRLVIASCQFPISKDISSNADWICRQMRTAKVRGAELVHFPECALSGYAGVDFDSFDDFDWKKLKAHTESVRQLAQALNLWIILGTSHPLGNGHKPHNSLYVINPEGQIVGRYGKRFCTQRDLKHFTPGNHFVQFGVHDISCGLLICYDIRFPELFREYCKLGTDVIFHSFYNARHKKDCIHPKIMPVTAQARAATNGFFVSLTNSSAPYSWPCHFITPDGLVEKKLPANRPGILISEIDASQGYYDASRAFRMDAINGKLHSGATVEHKEAAEGEKEE